MRCACPTSRLTNRRAYLDPLNFATNFAFFRDTGEVAHAARDRELLVRLRRRQQSRCWMTLFDADGEASSPNGARIAERSASRDRDRQPRRARRFATARLRRPAFPAHRRGGRARRRQIRARRLWRRTRKRRHGALSCTHDANAWPADRYAGLPAPAPGERVVLWVQNSHPIPIPPARSASIRWARSASSPDRRGSIAPFASRAVDVARTACRTSPGRARSNCAPASTSCGRATR